MIHITFPSPIHIEEFFLLMVEMKGGGERRFPRGEGAIIFLFYLFFQGLEFGGGSIYLNPPLGMRMIHTIQYVRYHTTQACKIFPSPVAGMRKERKGGKVRSFYYVCTLHHICVIKNGGEGRERAFALGRSIISYIEKICLLHVIPGEGVGAQLN